MLEVNLSWMTKELKVAIQAHEADFNPYKARQKTDYLRGRIGVKWWLHVTPRPRLPTLILRDGAKPKRYRSPSNNTC